MKTVWPADKVERRAVASLVPYARNARTHSPDQVDQIAASIREFGWTIPVLVDEEGTLIAGHGRVMAAKKLGIGEVPVMIAEGWSEAQRKAYVLADNKLALNAGWDNELLRVELDGLKELDFDISLTGFSGDELVSILAEKTEGLTDPDETPEPPLEPVSVLGDVWLLGKHRIVCGDCTTVESVDKVMAGTKADMCFTSPPYNADTKAGQGDIFNKKKSVKLYSDNYSDNLKSSDYVDFASNVLEICFSVTDGFIFWNVSYNAKSRFEYIQQITNRLSYLVEQICWKKTSTIPFKGSLMRDWEPIYVFSTNKQPISVKIVTSNFWQVSNTGSQTENHKACFPVDLPKKAIDIVAVNTGIIFEPFSGSGTTIIAAEMTGRCCHAIELNPAYVDVAIERWQNFTGQQATLEATGETFSEVKSGRGS